MFGRLEGSVCEIKEGIVYISASNSDKVYICDLDDYEKVCDKRWNVNNSGYAYCYNVNTKSSLHAIIIGYQPSGRYVIDHINRDKLDNRRCNLRVVTWQQNSINSSCGKNNKSKTKGVRAHGKGWQAYISINRKMYLFGTYKTIEEARIARLLGEKKYHEPIMNGLN